MSERISRLSPLKQAYLAIEDLEARLAEASEARRQPIAIIGMACRFPGGANDPESYWQLLRSGFDAVREVPADRWDVDAYYDPDPEAPGKMTTRSAGFLTDVDVRSFDAAFFGIAPREAVSMDPQQRLLLEVAWEALEHGALAPERLTGTRTGVFVGISGNEYGTLALAAAGSGAIDAYSGTGNVASVAAGRLSYVLGLEGPCYPVDTACSSSLVTAHLACQSLRLEECDVALVAGVNLILAPTASVYFSKLRATSTDGRCKAFDAAADGYGRGEGCGVVVLKRLADARADGDRILGLIVGSAINHDGRSSGLTAPSGPAQQAVIRAALADARVAPADVTYVEAHGTGTPLGDPIEIGSLAAVYGEDRPRDQPLIIASVKTNIGHLEAAAGIAGLIKATLALQAGEIPPHLHLERVSPYITLEAIPAIIPTSLLDWPASARRIAAVSSFGFSGTNAHLILAPPPARDADEDRRASRGAALLTVSARTAGALRELGARIEQHLREHSEVDVASLCHTLQAGRSHLVHRLAVVGRDAAQLGERLRSAATSERAHGIFHGEVFAPAKLALAFPADAPASAAAIEGLRAREPAFAREWERCIELARRVETAPLLDGARDARTAIELFVLEVALGNAWCAWGVAPSYLLASGVGEYAAACVAGVLSLEDGMRLAAARDRVREADTSAESVAAFARVAASVRPAAPRLALVASLSGTPIASDALPDAAYWVEQLRAPPREIAVPAALGIDIVVDLAPERGAAGPTPRVRGFPDGDEALLESMAALYVRGVRIDWSALAGGRVPRLALPTYPWQRKVFWFADPEVASTAPPSRSAPLVVPLPVAVPPPLSALDPGAEKTAGRYYDLASRSASRDQRELVSERFAPLDEVIPGFSWLAAIHDPDRNRAHLDAIVEAQRGYRQKAFAGIDFSALVKVLDFGCGNGFDLIDLGRANAHLRLDGYNISSEEAETCNRRIREHHLGERLRVFNRDSARDAFPDHYDMAFGFQVVHNIRLELRRELFDNIASHLAPGGLLVLGDYMVCGVSPLSHEQASSYIATQEQWIEQLAQSRLRITRVTDIGQGVANFFDDPQFETSLAAITAANDLDPMLVAGLRMYDALGKLLRKGLVRYVLLLAQRERHLEPAEIARLNRAALEPSGPTVPAPAPGLREALQAAAPERRRVLLRGHLHTQVARVLGLPADELDTRLPLSQAGLSSLMAVELQGQVETQLGLAVPVAELLDGPSIDELAGRLCDGLTAASLRPVPAMIAPPGEVEELVL